MESSRPDTAEKTAERPKIHTKVSIYQE